MKIGQYMHHIFYGRMKKGRAIFTMGAFVLMCMIAFVYLYATVPDSFDDDTLKRLYGLR